MAKEKEKEVWIQNTYNGDILVKAKIVSKDDPRQFVIEEQLFQHFKTDQLTGRMESSGYTAIPEGKYNRLIKNSLLFSKGIKSKKFIKYDEPPLSSQTPQEQLVYLHAEVARLNGELEAAKRDNGGEELTKVKEALVAEQTKVGELTEQLDVAKEALVAEQTKVGELTEQLEAAEIKLTELTEIEN